MIVSFPPANILAIAAPNSPRLRQISFLLFAAAGQPEGHRGEEVSDLSSRTERAAPTCRYRGLIRDPADG